MCVVRAGTVRRLNSIHANGRNPRHLQYCCPHRDIRVFCNVLRWGLGSRYVRVVCDTCVRARPLRRLDDQRRGTRTPRVMINVAVFPCLPENINDSVFHFLFVLLAGRRGLTYMRLNAPV